MIVSYPDGVMKKIVGMDIGATNLRIALMQEDGKILSQSSEKTDSKRLMEQIYCKLDTYGDFEGIGIASVGPLDSRKGIITNPPNIDIKDLHIIELLNKKYGKPAYLLNDCVAAVLAEKQFGMGKEVENLVYITLSTGIGCGVIADNRVILGKDGNAHEVGHYIVDTESTLKCGCGSYGHWEAYCAGKNIPQFAKFLLGSDYKGKETVLNNGTVVDLTSEKLFQLANTDVVAKEIVERVGKINAIEVAAIINAYDPELITIGGSVATNNEKWLMEALEKHVKNYTINRMPRISMTPLGSDIGIYGGVAGFLYFNGKGIL